MTQKAEQCDRLLDAISLERARIEKKKSPPLSYEIESDISLASLAREIVSLKEGQTRITQILEMMQLEIRNKPNSSVNLPSQASSIPTITQPYPAMFSSVGGGSLTTSPTNLNGSDTFFPKSPTSVDSTGLSDPKYKELKKKLLMANLKILELQNRSQKLPSV